MRRITSSRRPAISSSVKSWISLTFGFFAMIDITNTGIPLQLARANAINAYASVEQSLCHIFGHLLGTELNLAAIVFYSITNTHSRNRIIEELLKKRHGTTYEAYWNGVPRTANKRGTFTIIRELDQSRNELVHWHIGFTHGEIPGIGLTKPTSLAQPNAPSISLQDLIQFVEKADFVHRSLNIFFALVSTPRTAPEADALQALREIFQQPASYPPSDMNPLSRNYKAPEILPQPSPS
jgi:hypothetical protein